MTNAQFNLLFSLPDELITEIYGTFDPTYRIFHTPEFRKELAGAGWLNQNKKSVKSCVWDHIFDLFYDDERNFKNEYGYLGEVELTREDAGKFDLHKRTIPISFDDRFIPYNENNFQIYVHPAMGEYKFFKILPKGATKKNCAFLRNPQKFDGFVCHEVTGKEDWLNDWDDTLAMPHLITNDPRIQCSWNNGICLFLCHPIRFS